MLIAVSTAHCGDGQVSEQYQRPKVWPKPTPPPDASPVYHDVKEAAPTEEEIERADREHNDVLERDIADAFASRDVQKREAVIVFLLPELLQVAPERVLKLIDRQKPGADREQLLTEVARLWASQDVDAAANWIKTLKGQEQREAVVTAVSELAPFEPAQAAGLAQKFGLEKDEKLRRLLTDVRN